jgi:hypothetical protein
MFALLRVLESGGEVKSTAVVSIIISALAVGVHSAMISFDFDVDPKKREEAPDFYGYIPENGSLRSAIFVCMTLLSAVMVLFRCSGAVLLISLGRGFFGWSIAVDMGLFFLYKLVRCDAHHWIPIYGVVGGVCGFFIRFVIKAVTDYTGIVHFRHSVDLGGVYWSANVVVSIGMTYTALNLYYADKVEGSNGFMKKEDAADLLNTAVGVLAVLFACFLKLMKKEYRRTFRSLETGNQFAQKFFLEGVTDQQKVEILTHNCHQWGAIREEVGYFTRANWAKWLEEEPEWFNEAFRDRIDDDLLPPEALGAMVVTGGGKRRRSSLLTSISPKPFPRGKISLLHNVKLASVAPEEQLV